MTIDSLEFLAVFGLGPESRRSYANELAFAMRVEYVPLAVGRGASVVDSLRDIACDLTARGATRAVLDISEEALVTEVVGAAAEADARIGSIASVIDTSMTRQVMNSDAAISRLSDDADASPFDIPLSVLLTSQCEYSTHIVAIGEHDLDFIRALGPEADVVVWDGVSVPEIPARVADVSQVVPGWLHRINGSLESPGRIGVVRYERERPFHPGRLFDLLENEEEWAEVLRVVGFSRLASRPGVLSLWEQSGATINIDPYETDWWADPESEHECAGACDSELSADPVLGQDLVAIGVDLDVEALERDLDACLLTDEEFLDGVWAWVTYEDAFPA